MPEQVITLKSLPGIKRDGTRLEGDNYVDGQWVRFQRGLPRKIGGYRMVNQYLSDIPRTLHEYTRDQLTYIHAGSATGVERFYFDGAYTTSAVSDRTPTTLTASEANLWQFDVETAPGLGGAQLLAQVAPNLNCICNSLGGQLFYGDLFGTGPLTELTVAGGNLPVGVSLTGGVVSLHPYTFIFGNDGYVAWSTAGDPTDFVSTGSGSANITGQKIVRGMPLRGGAGNSPSGLFWSADSLLRASFVGGEAIFQFDTISAETSIMSAQSVIEYDGIFYWVGSDRFLSFNGVVREIENGLNQNFFFDSLNYEQRQKVFAVKVPRFGEIWWCFPKDDAIEPNHAVIYNVRENTWYDLALPEGGRSAGIFPAVFRRPLMAGVEPAFNDIDTRITEAGDTRITESGATRITEESGNARYKFWVHEVGTDKIDGLNIQPIPSYFETADISLPVQAGQNSALQVLLVEPDFVQTGDMTLEVHGRANARSPEVNSDPVTFPETATTPQEQVVFLKTQRRELRFRFESNTLGGDYQMGTILVHVRPGDGTVLG